MINDVDALGARLFFTGLVYVADTRHCANPLYFAPHLGRECVRGNLIPEVAQPGVQWLSQVIEVVALPFSQLFPFPNGFTARSDPRWPRWMLGIMGWGLRAERAQRSGKGWDRRTLRVYLLAEPIRIERPVLKGPGQDALGAHFGKSLYQLFSGPHLGRSQAANA